MLNDVNVNLHLDERIFIALIPSGLAIRLDQVGQGIFTKIEKEYVWCKNGNCSSRQCLRPGLCITRPRISARTPRSNRPV